MGPPRWIPWVFVGVAVILFAVAAGFALNNLAYRDAETATGTVIEHEYSPIRREDDDGRSRTRDAWKEVVQWTDHNGETHTLVGDVSSTRPKAIGSDVTVQYYPDDVSSARLAGFWDQWLVTAITSGMGLMFGLFGVVLLRIFRRTPALSRKDLPPSWRDGGPPRWDGGPDGPRWNDRPDRPRWDRPDDPPRGGGAGFAGPPPPGSG